MQSITIAIVELGQDQHQQVSIRELLRHNDSNFELLTDIQSNYDNKIDRRCVARDDLTFVDNAIARICRLNPQVLLINANKSRDEYCDLLLALHYHCPDTRAILIINETIEEDYLVKALSCGARGFITDHLDSLDFSKVVQAIHRGEAWVPRKMIGRIMHQIVSASRHDFPEANFDSLS